MEDSSVGKGLPYNPEDLSLSLRTHLKMKGMVADVCNSIIGGGREQ